MLQLQPNLDAWSERGLDVIFVTMATGQSAKAFLDQNKVTGLQVLLDPWQAMTKKYLVKGVPTSYIIDQQGVVRYAKVGWGSDSLDQVTKEIDRICPP